MGEVERIVAGLTDEERRLLAVYRLLALNEGWNWRMVDAYGHAEYARQHLAEIDRKALSLFGSGYDAEGYLAGLQVRADLASMTASTETASKEGKL